MVVRAEYRGPGALSGLPCIVSIIPPGVLAQLGPGATASAPPRTAQGFLTSTCRINTDTGHARAQYPNPVRVQLSLVGTC